MVVLCVQEGTEAPNLGVQTANQGQAPKSNRSWSSAKDVRQTLRDCLSTETSASRRHLAEAHDIKTVTDSHMPDQEQNAPHGLNQVPSPDQQFGFSLRTPAEQNHNCYRLSLSQQVQDFTAQDYAHEKFQAEGIKGCSENKSRIG